MNIKQLILLSFLSLNLSGQSYQNFLLDSRFEFNMSYKIQGKDTIYRVNGKTYIIINGDSFHLTYDGSFPTYHENHKIIGSRAPKVHGDETSPGYGMMLTKLLKRDQYLSRRKSGNPSRRTNYSSSSSCCSPSKSDVSVRGYYRKDGTYVRPHMRTAPNGTKRDNFSFKGNTNPYHKKN